MEDLWMKSLWDLEPEVLSAGGRRLWWSIVPSTLDLSLYKSLHHPQDPWFKILHQTNAKNVLQRKLNKERMKSNLKTLSHTRKRLLYAEDNMMENLQCTTEAWWRFPITSRWLLRRSDLMMTEEVPHEYVPVLQLWYTLLFRSTWSLHSVPD